MAVQYRPSDLDLFLLATPDDTEDAPWMVMAGLQVRDVDLLKAILRLHIERQQLPWCLESYLKVTLPRPGSSVPLAAAPDLLMALAPDRLRTSWDIVAEGQPPRFVLEVSSSASWVRDSVDKPLIYRAMGVREYALFAPERRDGGPTLFGYRLDGRGRYRPWAVDRGGVLWSRELGGLGLYVEGELWLRAVDAEGQRLPTPIELVTAEQAARADADAVRREAAARTGAEAEIARLREELRRLREERAYVDAGDEPATGRW